MTVIKQFNMLKYLKAVNKLIERYLDNKMNGGFYGSDELIFDLLTLNNDVIKDLEK